MKLDYRGKDSFGKQWKSGALRILQTIDYASDSVILLRNFGTTNLPTGYYKHTSISRPDRYPSWDEILEIKKQLHGDKFVMMMLPPEEVYVNFHVNCFHLWEYIGRVYVE